jgi:hypothetical protein
MPRLLTRLFKPLFIIAACMLLYTLSMGTATATIANPITVTSQTETLAFPESIDFRMRAQDSSSTISQATIYLRYNNDGYLERHDVPLQTAQKTIQATWHENTTSNYYSAVGTIITYYWRITDTVGSIHNTQPQSFTVTDTRFQWQHLTQGYLHVNWYNRPQDFGQTVLDQAKKDLMHIQANLGGGLTQPITIWVYANALDFHNALPSQIHEWVGGIAFPNLNQASIVVYTSNDDTLIRDMPHEITHLVFHQVSGANTTVPLWFDEGLAVYNQLYHEPEMSRRFKQALPLHALLRLSAISASFPADANNAYLAYAQSWNLVGYMYTTFGEPRMAALIHDLNHTDSDWNNALTKDLRMNQDHLENQWRLSLNQPAILVPDQEDTISKNLLTIKQAPMPAINDPLAPLLLIVGLLMVLLPICGFGGLLLFWKINRRQNVINQQLQRSSQPGYSPAPTTFPHDYYSGQGYSDSQRRRTPQE